MSRTYWPRNSVSMPEGRTLDGARCTQLIQQVTAVEEEARYYTPCVLPYYEAAGSDWYRIGFAPMRFDRDGMMRKLSLSPLCAGGSGQAVLRCFLLDSWMAPDVDLDDYAQWNVSTGTTLSWQTAATLTPSRERLFPGRVFPDGDELVRTRFGILVWQWASVATSPRFGGWVVEELVED